MSNSIKTALLLGLMSALLMGLGEMLGGGQGLVAGFFFAVAMNFGSYWFSDKIVLRMYRAQEVGPGHRLYSTVERLARQAGLPMPKVYIMYAFIGAVIGVTVREFGMVIGVVVFGIGGLIRFGTAGGVQLS